jgi:hypothetical protein
MDLIAEYATAFPADLKLYKSIFLSLGIYYSSHELTESESVILTAYLEDGGKLYMEGRLTWFMDPQTGLHEMFNINTEEVNWYEYDSITGLPGTFAEAMIFGYDMTQPYNNYYLIAEEPAFELMNSLPGSTAVMVAYDAGDYKTIGSSAEFGGLVDGTYPSTKAELMSEILEFFGDIFTGTEEHHSENKTTAIRVYPNPFHDIVYFDIRLLKTETVKLEITDITGRIISEIYEGKMEEGLHHLSWRAINKANYSISGVYFLRIICEDEIQIEKLILTE